MHPEYTRSAATQSTNHSSARLLASDSIPIPEVDRWVRRFPWAAFAGAFSIGFLAGLWLD